MEEAEITGLMEYFKNEKKAGNVEGEPCGLKKMWIIPKKCEPSLIHSIIGSGNKLREYKDIKCKGESPSLGEGKSALMMGRCPWTDGRAREDCTFFADDEF